MPLQFAFRPNRATDNAIAIALHTALSHLDKRNSHVRMLFLDYSSVFNIIVPSKLITELRALGLNPFHDCMATQVSNSIIKFADGTTEAGLITNNEETAYREEVRALAEWCQENNLSLHVNKMKELIMDNRTQQREYAPIHIDVVAVEKASRSSACTSLRTGNGPSTQTPW